MKELIQREIDLHRRIIWLLKLKLKIKKYSWFKRIIFKLYDELEYIKSEINFKSKI